MGKPFDIREKLVRLELTVEIVDTYSERVYLVEQHIRDLLKAVINNNDTCDGYRKAIKQLLILQILIENKIKKKEGYEAVMQQVTFL